MPWNHSVCNIESNIKQESDSLYVFTHFANEADSDSDSEYYSTHEPRHGRESEQTENASLLNLWTEHGATVA